MNATENVTNKFYNPTNPFNQNKPRTVKIPDKSNLTLDEQLSLKNLVNNDSLIIKPADKGSAAVLIDKSNYINEATRQLSNPKYYQKLTTPIFDRNIPKIKNILSQMLEKTI